MLRCASASPRRPRLAAALAFAATLTLAAPSFAQQPRNFPATALRGEIAVVQPPEALMNGRPARMSPGVRIRSEDNVMLVTGALVNRRLVVHYTVDISGLISEIWILTPSERARVPWPVTREQAAAWAFDPVAQTWTRP